MDSDGVNPLRREPPATGGRQVGGAVVGRQRRSVAGDGGGETSVKQMPTRTG